MLSFKEYLLTEENQRFHGLDDRAMEAIHNTPEAELNDEGLKLTVSRHQKPEQSGERAIRTGVFYLPERKSPYAKHYKKGANGYGGEMKVERTKLYKNPLMIKAGTGGVAISKAFDHINGKGSYEKMRSDVLNSCVSVFKTSKEKHLENVRATLSRHGGNAEYAEDIIRNSTKGNTFAYAMQEHIAAHHIRKAGYDAVISHSTHQGKPRLSEVFDVNEKTYPTDMSY